MASRSVGADTSARIVPVPGTPSHSSKWAMMSRTLDEAQRTRRMWSADDTGSVPEASPRSAFVVFVLLPTVSDAIVTPSPVGFAVESSLTFDHSGAVVQDPAAWSASGRMICGAVGCSAAMGHGSSTSASVPTAVMIGFSATAEISVLVSASVPSATTIGPAEASSGIAAGRNIPNGSRIHRSAFSGVNMTSLSHAQKPAIRNPTEGSFESWNPTAVG